MSLDNGSLVYVWMGIGSSYDPVDRMMKIKKKARLASSYLRVHIETHSLTTLLTPPPSIF